MDHTGLRHAKQALLGKPLLGYRRAAGAAYEPTATAKVGAIKNGPAAQLVRTAEAKVGLNKPPPPLRADR